MFSASDIDILDYDFSGFFDGGPKGIVPEPSTESISAYQLAISNLMESAEERIKAIVNDAPATDEEKLSEPEKNSEIDQLNQQTWIERKKLLAELCQQQPSFEDINRLPHRVFMKFEDYALGKWTPQAASAATK